MFHMNTYPAIRSMSPQLVVADLERSIYFYTAELGFVVDFRYEDFYAGIIRDGYTIHLKAGVRVGADAKIMEKMNTWTCTFQSMILMAFLNRSKPGPSWLRNH
jgi:hypothetical protein